MSTAMLEEGNEKKHTYADYCAWDTEKRYELINGEAWMMSAPGVIHQTISRELLGQFWNFLKGKPCRVFAAPLDVRLFPREDDGDDTVLQPDLLVVCDGEKLADGRSCRGAPDLVAEILSSSNTWKYLSLKFQLYLKAGVREYWLIEPETRIIQVHLLKEGEPDCYLSRVYRDPQFLEVSVLPGLTIDAAGIRRAS
ncbi:MAG: Uma2 family endonuclease [Spirochaetaceae bacterium]|jgi:Uma2 family endonuclease|nr:Uma2 family endonuclease [Spirochaetaceae bacterium]